MSKPDRNNYAFIDGQNLYMGTAKREVDPWKVDLARLALPPSMIRTRGER